MYEITKTSIRKIIEKITLSTFQDLLKKVIKFSNNIFIITSKYLFRKYYYVITNLKSIFEIKEIIFNYIDIKCEFTLINKAR